MTKHQYNLGVIGNCSYLAYIDKQASIKWLCWPRFDSSFVFGSLLDNEKGGEFSIQPEGEFTTEQFYFENTNVLCTEFTTPQGRFRVLDCAPRFNQYERTFRPLMLVRKIEILEGAPSIKIVCNPRTDYGQGGSAHVVGSNHITFTGYDTPMRLTTNASLSYIQEQTSFILNKSLYLVLTYGEPLEAPLKTTAEDFINKTIRYWQDWIKSTYIPDIYQAQVIRSALVLKLHQYEDTGGIIASGTTSLPEHDGSQRTWDYRYCWFRDSYYTLKAFNEIGHFDELEKYFEFIENILMRNQERISPLYTIKGEEPPEEIHLPLAGYLDNQPVRIGNKAFEQIQNDVYGQILVGLLPLFTDKRLTLNKRSSFRPLIVRLLDWIEKTMDEPDAGLWEFRNVKQVHTYTLLFHWAGSEAACKLARILKDEELFEKADRLRKQAAIQLEMCYDTERKVYSQAMGVTHLDASTLKMITMNYLDPTSEKAKLHLRELESLLKTEQGLFYRYLHPDDFGKPHATFLVCAFWYVDALACVGRVDDARKTLDTILSFSNHLGIFSEDVGLDGSQWGNYPQTYSHVGLINAVFRIAKKMDLPGYLN
ncbi:glycoside hydrolase family 15 protein [Chryseotalea sanaruensis]|uniref:Glycoside hydrolase family 15 protein n=1 Tax=Chryseotalea sanaruensis TaxID=2482724 RepID=A0A401U5C3_9BACT|nr:glycoside hydrolase family 15 protein [Chryseotalea sanaruensis]GCC50128.1 glycoside hydrolase family 15 protein [Chryseotalea sanaruensis]